MGLGFAHLHAEEFGGECGYEWPEGAVRQTTQADAQIERDRAVGEEQHPVRCAHGGDSEAHADGARHLVGARLGVRARALVRVGFWGARLGVRCRRGAARGLGVRRSPHLAW